MVEPLDVLLPEVPDVGPRELRLSAGPPAPGGLVAAAVDKPADGPLRVPVLLSHGAGGDAFGSGLAALGRGLAELGHETVRFNLPYREAGRSAPPPAERSVPGYRAAYEDARTKAAPGWGSRPWAVGGKSYGGRVASMAVAGGLDAAGLVFYGYPLHPPGRPESLRVDHWPSITVPCLFLEGTEDPFCNLVLLDKHIGSLGGPATVHVVQGGDHSLKVRGAGRSPKSAAVVMAELAPMVSTWLDGLVSPTPRT
jgi:predicted alpha/beta-hydrolase family hydrolase